MLIKKQKSTLARKRALTAQIFLIPFYLGLWFFFLNPVAQSIRMSFSSVSVDVGGYNFEPTGLDNYKTAFLSDTDFTTNMIGSLTDLLWKVPIIILLSLCMALIINQKFRGRIIVRAIFFLPVIFASGVVLLIVRSDSVATQAMNSNSSIVGGVISSNNSLHNFLINAGLSSKIVNIATKISSSMFSLVWSSGLQMIIFLAGLQSIPPSLYEASSIEGASFWENFWKVTVPMLSPIILLNVIYTIIDTFTDASNKVMNQIINISSQQIDKMGLSAAFAWSYFIVIGIVLSLVILVYSKINRE